LPQFSLLAGFTPMQQLGYCFIFTVALIWVIASFVVQEIVSSGIPPFVLTYFCNSMFVMYLPVSELGHFFKRLRDEHKSLKAMKEGDADDARLLGEGGAEPPDGGGEADAAGADVAAPYTRMETARAALAICPIWFSAQYMFNLSLSKTSVTANTILSSLATLFTFLLSVAVLRERFTLRKLLGVGLCILGTALVTVRDSDSEAGGSRDTGVGDLLCLASALFYGVYTVSIRKLLPDDNRISTALFFGYVGLFNAVLLFPLVLAMQEWGGVDLAQLPVHALRLTFLKGLFDNVLSDYLWARAVLLVGPTVASAGMTIQVPMAIVVEIALGKAAWLHSFFSATMMISGGAVIIFGFLIVSTQSFSA